MRPFSVVRLISSLLLVSIPITAVLREAGSSVGLPLAAVWIASAMIIALPRVAAAAFGLWMLIPIWVAAGTFNVWVTRYLWQGWSGDSLVVHNQFAVYSLAIAIGASLLSGRFSASHRAVDEQQIRRNRNVEVVLWIFVAVFSILKLQSAGWTGVWSGEVTDANRADQLILPGVGRLSIAFPMLACARATHVARSGRISRADLALFLVAAFVLLSGGSRWAFFQFVVAGSMAVLLLRPERSALRKLLLPASLLMFLVIASIPVIAALRTQNMNSASRAGSVFGVLSTVGGEYRDAAFAVTHLGAEDRRLIRAGYWRQVIAPLVPGPLRGRLGLTESALRSTAPHRIMQDLYEVDSAIRVGVVFEMWIVGGFLAVGALGIAVSGLLCMLLWLARDRSLFGVSLAAISFPSMAFLPAGQADAILAPATSFISVWLLIVVVLWLLGRISVRRVDLSIAEPPI